jgi:hypothetical protein
MPHCIADFQLKYIPFPKIRQQNVSGSYQQGLGLIMKATLPGNGIIVSCCGEYINESVE